MEIAIPHTAAPAPAQPAQNYPLPYNEALRLNTLHDLDLLDTESEAAFDDLVSIAAAICETPVALVSLVDADRQWFKARMGVDVDETPRSASFCARAILRPDELMEVGDASKDPRFSDNPLVTGDMHLRFYAGAPLLVDNGVAIGSLCVIDSEPRQLTPVQRQALQALSRQTVAYMKLRKQASQLALQSTTDALTGVWNRRGFDQRLQQEWSRHLRSGHSLAMMMLDIDHFKSFNDSFGHPAGDMALASTAKIMSQTLRTEDFCARYGGEEFAVLLPGLDMNAAHQAAERLRQAVANASWPHRAITVSIGVSALAPSIDGNPNTLVARADCALYQAKAMGRNRSVRFEQWEAATQPCQEASSLKH